MNGDLERISTEGRRWILEHYTLYLQPYVFLRQLAHACTAHNAHNSSLPISTAVASTEGNLRTVRQPCRVSLRRGLRLPVGRCLSSRSQDWCHAIASWLKIMPINTNSQESLVSVIPTYNRPDYLKDAIGSAVQHIEILRLVSDDWVLKSPKQSLTTRFTDWFRRNPKNLELPWIL